MNVLNFSTVCAGLCEDRIRKIWQPMLDWIVESPNAYTVVSPAFHRCACAVLVDAEYMNARFPGVFPPDLRRGPTRCMVGE